MRCDDSEIWYVTELTCIHTSLGHAAAAVWSVSTELTHAGALVSTPAAR